MEENKEKKSIKISLFSFYVLIAGIVMIIAALILAGFMILGNANKPIEIANNQTQNSVVNSENKNNTTNEFKTGKYVITDLYLYENPMYGDEDIIFKDDKTFEAYLGWGAFVSGNYNIDNDIINCIIDKHRYETINQNVNAFIKFKVINDLTIEVLDSSDEYKIKVIDLSTGELMDEYKDYYLDPFIKGNRFEYHTINQEETILTEEAEKIIKEKFELLQNMWGRPHTYFEYDMDLEHAFLKPIEDPILKTWTYWPITNYEEVCQKTMTSNFRTIFDKNDLFLWSEGKVYLADSAWFDYTFGEIEKIEDIKISSSEISCKLKTVYEAYDPDLMAEPSIMGYSEGKFVLKKEHNEWLIDWIDFDNLWQDKLFEEGRIK